MLQLKPYSIPKQGTNVAGIRGVCLCNCYGFERGILNHQA
jgi:hypothetical protein